MIDQIIKKMTREVENCPESSDSQTSEWYSYFENDVLVIYPAAKECMNNCTFGERDSIMLLFTHRYPARYFGMNVPKS